MQQGLLLRQSDSRLRENSGRRSRNHRLGVGPPPGSSGVSRPCRRTYSASAAMASVLRPRFTARRPAQTGPRDSAASTSPKSEYPDAKHPAAARAVGAAEPRSPLVVPFPRVLPPASSHPPQLRRSSATGQRKKSPRMCAREPSQRRGAAADASVDHGTSERRQGISRGRPAVVLGSEFSGGAMASVHPFRGDGSRTASEKEFLEVFAAYLAEWAVPGVPARSFEVVSRIHLLVVMTEVPGVDVPAGRCRRRRPAGSPCSRWVPARRLVQGRVSCRAESGNPNTRSKHQA